MLFSAPKEVEARLQSETSPYYVPEKSCGAETPAPAGPPDTPVVPSDAPPGRTLPGKARRSPGTRRGERLPELVPALPGGESRGPRPLPRPPCHPPPREATALSGGEGSPPSHLR